MARKRYQIDFVINSNPAELPARRVVRLLENAEAAARRAGSAMVSAYARAGNAAEQAAAKMAAASTRMGQAGGSGGAGRGGSRSAGVASPAQLQGVEDRYFKRDYDRRVKAEARNQELAAAAAVTATRQADKKATQLQGIEDRYFQRDYANKVRAEVRNQQQAAAAAEAIARQGEAKAAKLAAVEDRYTQRDYAGKVAYERKQVAQKDRTARQLASVEDRYLRDEYRKRVAFQARQASEQEAAAQAAVARGGQILAIGLGVATAAALAGLKVFIDGFAKIREDAEKAAAATLALRKTLQVESVLKGGDQTTDKELLESLTFRAETALGEADATEFTRQYLGSVPIARQKKNITPQVEKELMTQAGIMAARQGGSASTRGELAGLLGQFGKVESASAGLGQLEAIRIALMEGRGDDTPLTKQLLATAGAMVSEGGVVGSLQEQAALIGVTSLSAGPGRAGTRAEQLNRALRGGIGDKGTRGRYMNKLGVKENDNLETILGKIVPDLRRARSEGRNPDSYLKEQEFGNQAERRALLEVEQVYDQLVIRFENAREASSNAGPANQRFLASPLGRQGVGEALMKAAEVSRGIPGERSLALLAEAEASPEFQKSEESIGGYLGNIFTGGMEGHFWNPSKRGRELRLQGVASGILTDRATKAGVTSTELEGAATNFRTGGENFPSYVNEVEGLIARHGGGGIGADIKPALDRLTAVMAENNQLLKDNNQRMGPPQPIAPPAPQALGRRP